MQISLKNYISQSIGVDCWLWYVIQYENLCTTKWLHDFQHFRINIKVILQMHLNHYAFQDNGFDIIYIIDQRIQMWPWPWRSKVRVIRQVGLHQYNLWCFRFYFLALEHASIGIDMVPKQLTINGTRGDLDLLQCESNVGQKSTMYLNYYISQ